MAILKKDIDLLVIPSDYTLKTPILSLSGKNVFFQDVDFPEEPLEALDFPKESKIIKELMQYPLDIFIKPEYELPKDKEPKIKL